MAQFIAFVRAHFWQIATALLAILFIFFFIRPFESRPDPGEEDVAQAWNTSVGRLGIEPVFPPEEDFHVGDVWAVVVYRNPGIAANLPLLGKALRIGHIDLRSDIVNGQAGLPVFEDTVDTKDTDKFRRQGRKEVETKSDNLISLSIAAFPGITISHANRVAGGATSGWLGLGGARRDTLAEEIRIPTAETYGIPAEAAYRNFQKWCADKKTAFYCKDDSAARTILTYALGSDALDDKAGAYDIQLSLITRVFLTREIQQKNQLTDDRAALVQVSDKPGGATPPSSPATPQSPDVDRSAAAASAGGPNASVNRSDGVEIGFRQVYQRPVVFGFRSLKLLLPVGPTANRKASP